MSFLTKKNKKTKENKESKKVLFVHPAFEIIEYNKIYDIIVLTKNDDNITLFNRWYKILEELFSNNKQGYNYLLKTEDLEDFIEFVQNLNKKHKKKDKRSYESNNKKHNNDLSSDSDEKSDRSKYSDEEEEEYSSKSDESTDDELIQKTLSRRLKSASNQQIIEEENISDSEMEDVISICRRLRYLLKNINEIKNKLIEIEKKIEKRN
jgi:hypothetical protein